MTVRFFMFNEVALVILLLGVCIDSSSKQLWGGGIIAAFVHLSWKAACFAPLSLNVSLPFSSVRLIKCLRRGRGPGSSAQLSPCSENTSLFLFVPWNLKLESCFPASWWPEHCCGNRLKDVAFYVPHGPITPLHNLRRAGQIELIK